MLKLQDLITFLELVDKDLKESIHKDRQKDAIVLLQSIKVSEELGELHNEILKLFKNQREEKIIGSSLNLSNELADVILATLLLGIQLEVDVEKALLDKMSVITKRHVK
jgi:NTP pyrophosphatase (non-canonical NTP hydrolase)